MPFLIDRDAQLITAAKEQMQAGQFKQARNTCLEILGAKPDHLDALLIVGVASLNLGTANTAEVHLKEALRFLPNDANLHCNLGIALAMQCELKRAENAFKKAVELQPSENNIRKHLEQARKERQRINNKIQQTDKNKLPPKITYSAEERESGLPNLKTVNEATSLFRHFGYLIVENLFDKSYVENIYAYFRNAFPDAFQTSQSSVGNKVFQGRSMIKTPIDGPFKDSAFYAPDLLYPVLNQLLGDQLIMLTLGTVVSYPGAPEQRIHSDHFPLFGDENLNRQVPPFAVTVAMPLIDMNDVTGTTRMYDKTQLRLGFLSKDEKQRYIEPEISAGSVLLFDYRVHHCGTANHSTNIRPLVCGVYSKPWFRDAANYFRQEAMLISDEVYEHLSPKYLKLFEWTRYGEKADSGS